MGGYGSGRWGIGHSAKDTVEDCHVLSAAWLQSKGLLALGQCVTGQNLTWTSSATGEKRASIGIDLDAFYHPESPTARLYYTRTRHGEGPGESMDYRVGLTTTPLPWGGVRWWFVCPLSGCRRRVGKLYLPPGGRYFGCRHCCDLTYESCRESHMFDRMYGMLAAQAGFRPEDVKRLLNRERDL